VVLSDAGVSPVVCGFVHDDVSGFILTVSVCVDLFCVPVFRRYSHHSVVFLRADLGQIRLLVFRQRFGEAPLALFIRGSGVHLLRF
jgi:hypothetical protein